MDRLLECCSYVRACADEARRISEEEAPDSDNEGEDDGEDNEEEEYYSFEDSADEGRSSSTGRGKGNKKKKGKAQKAATNLARGVRERSRELDARTANVIVRRRGGARIRWRQMSSLDQRGHL